MIDRVVQRLGVDARQWRALVASYIRMDLRAGGGPVRRRGERPPRSQLLGLAIVGMIGSVAFAVIAAALPDVALTAALLTTYAAATTVIMLLADFTAVVIAPEDYAILAARPVDSRTYFAARLAAVGVYVGTLSAANALLPALVYAVKVGPLAFPATVAALILCDLCTAVLVITGCVVLLQYVHPRRLTRATAYLQLLGSTLFYLIYYVGTLGFRRAAFESMVFDRMPWLWLVPSTWFAAFVPIAASGGTPAAWLAAAAALLLTAGCVPLAAGRLSLDYARRIGEATAVSEPAAERRAFRLPGFARDEPRAVALLVRAQFRFDQRFRMGVLSILPLTGFYLLMGLDEGALRDPFAGGGLGPGVYFAVMFIPMTLHTTLAASESWRAAWIFFATPASHARIVVAAKNFVSVYLLGAYVAALAVFWSFFFDRVWHAVLHAAVLGAVAHILLQLTVITRPLLPFASEPHKAQRSLTMFLLFLGGGVIAGIFPLLLRVIYRSGAATIGMCLLLVAMTAAIEYALRLRVDEAIGELEFRN